MEKIYLIIGASSDVSISYIEYLTDKLKSGCDSALIIAHYFSNKEKLEKLSAKCSNVKIVPVKADLSQTEGIELLADEVAKISDHIDYYLHFPASKFQYMRFKEADMDIIRTELNVQLFSFLNISKMLFPKMKNIPGSRAVVMLTKYVDDDLPPKFMTDYVITKYALLGAMKAAAVEFGGKNLMINGISPIMMNTKFLQNIDERIIEMNAANSSLGRLVEPGELISHIERLLSPDLNENGNNFALDEADFTA